MELEVVMVLNLHHITILFMKHLKKPGKGRLEKYYVIKHPYLIADRHYGLVVRVPGY
jgi:hypothetical protein